MDNIKLDLSICERTQQVLQDAIVRATNTGASVTVEVDNDFSTSISGETRIERSVIRIMLM